MYQLTQNNKEIWIIGYGNPHLGDDAIGSYIVDVLKKSIHEEQSIYFRCFSRLTPGVVHQLKNATNIIFIDATVQWLKKGWRLMKVEPEIGEQLFLTTSATPGYLLGLIESVYKRSPSAWRVSVQGYDFGMETEFYPETRKNVGSAITFLRRFVKKIMEVEGSLKLNNMVLPN